MEAISKTAGDLSSPDRTALEHLLGRPLAADDHVLVVAFQPGEQDEALREAARARIRATAQRAAQHASAAGITPAEADAAILEAMAVIRPRATT